MLDKRFPIPESETQPCGGSDPTWASLQDGVMASCFLDDKPIILTHAKTWIEVALLKKLESKALACPCRNDDCDSIG